jgi:PAS domain S-box-containing protein
MKVQLTRPVFDRDEYYEASSRTIRWIILFLVLISFPFASENGLVVLTLIILTAVYNALRYSRSIMSLGFFTSRLNSLAVDHAFVLSLVILSGGLASPYYPLFFLLILAVIASYGIAGFALSLSSQVIISLILLKVQSDALPDSPEFKFIIGLVLLIVFSLVAEQSVRSRDEEYLLSSRFTRRIENERQRLLSLINSLRDAVLAIDSDGKVYLYNAAALELLNTNRDISGTSITDLLPLHDANGVRMNPMRLIADHSRTVNRQDLYYQAADGSKIRLDLTLSPVQVFGYAKESWGGYMAVFRDITKQKSLDEQRDEFISVTSHELRTPLAIAEANLSTALLPGFAKIPPKAHNLLTQTHDNIVFLSELIEDLTTLSRAERDDLKLKRQLVNTADFAEQLGRDYRAQAEARKLRLDVEIQPGVKNIYTSEHELREILQNFVTNAIKYTHKGRVTLHVEDAPGGVRFDVADTGIGISASDKTKIFSKFYRSEDYRTRATNGTGLGLYITHKLAEKLGVQITFSSRLNHGSTFSVLVPNNSAPAAAETVTAGAQHRLPETGPS